MRKRIGVVTSLLGFASSETIAPAWLNERIQRHLPCACKVQVQLALTGVNAGI
jgi:hypothetical protein